MAHPKRKSRKQEEKREEHYKATVAQIATWLQVEAHLYHRAYWHEENVLQRQVVIDKSVAVA
jgi:large subunit ribosomal protein L32